MMNEKQARKNNNIFFLHIKDKNELYQAYMPYVVNGGLFVKTNKTYHLGDKVFLMVKLLDEPEKFTIAGTVVWITPSCAQGGKPSGIGVQFTSEESVEFKKQIETYLAGALDSERFTETF
tara:strand:+ start:4294 stop:4653 length:360 start_codon:yes stop_codon:yes gene_type:complete